MREYTTPTLKITIKYRDGRIADDLVFTKLIFSLKGECLRIDKEIPSEDVIEGKFNVNLTQDETAQLRYGKKVRAEINFLYGEKRFATNILPLRIDENILNEVIDEESV